MAPSPERRMGTKLLLVNCYRESVEEKIAGYHDWLKAGGAAAGLELAVFDAPDRQPLPEGGEFAATIVSGSQKMISDGEIGPALAGFLREWRRPLLGICYGHQVLAAAFGAAVRRDSVSHLGDEEVLLREPGGIFAGFPARFPMRESHEEIVVGDAALAERFRVLAGNGCGLVEAIAHREFPLFGVQFHPERSGELGVKLLANFLSIVQNFG